MDSLSKLGIDFWSLLVYMVNFGVIVVVLAYFFTKPLLKTLDKRRDLIKGNIEEAEKVKEELVKQKEIMDAEKASLKAQFVDDMKKLHDEIAQKRKDADVEIEARKQAMLDDVRKVIDEEKKQLQASMQKETLELIQKIVLHIVMNKVPEDVISESVKESWKNFKRK